MSPIPIHIAAYAAPGKGEKYFQIANEKFYCERQDRVRRREEVLVWQER